MNEAHTSHMEVQVRSRNGRWPAEFHGDDHPVDISPSPVEHMGYERYWASVYPCVTISARGKREK